jgi:hypothetical protein
MDDKPLYVSRRSWRSLWMEYRVYQNRIELDSWLGRKVITADDIREIEIRPPFVGIDVFRGKSMAYGWALKLDMADLCRHVAIRRRNGIMKRLRFTPDDPEKFVEVSRSIMKQQV